MNSNYISDFDFHREFYPVPGRPDITIDSLVRAKIQHINTRVKPEIIDTYEKFIEYLNKNGGKANVEESIKKYIEETGQKLADTEYHEYVWVKYKGDLKQIIVAKITDSAGNERVYVYQPSLIQNMGVSNIEEFSKNFTPASNGDIIHLEYEQLNKLAERLSINLPKEGGADFICLKYLLNNCKDIILLNSLNDKF